MSGCRNQRNLRLKLTAGSFSKSWVWFCTPTQQFLGQSEIKLLLTEWKKRQIDFFFIFFAISSQKNSKITFSSFFFFFWQTLTPEQSHYEIHPPKPGSGCLFLQASALKSYFKPNMEKVQVQGWNPWVEVEPPRSAVSGIATTALTHCLLCRLYAK